MKIKCSISSEDGQEWVAEAKDVGLTTTGATMLSALERMQEEIRHFFADAFDSRRLIETVCSKVKATAYITVSPLETRPEKPLDNFNQESSSVVDNQGVLDGSDLLLLEGA